MTDAPEKVYVPRGAAKALWQSHAPEILIEGPAGTGKTRAVLEKINGLANKYAGGRFLITRKSRASMTETILVTYERDVLPELSPIKGNQQRSHRTHYEYPNGAVVVVGGMDNADRIMSGEYDVIATFESHELTEDDHEKLISRLRNPVMPYHQIISDTNPAHPGHWLNLRADAGRMQRLLSRHKDNPTLTPAYLEALSRLTGVRRYRLFEGKWAGSDGLVYDRWDRAVHVMEREGPWARVLLGVDDGYTNPLACVRCCVDGDGRVHIDAEGYGSGLNEAAKVETVRSISAGYERAICDPSAAGLRAALLSAGIDTTEAENDVIAGINRVQDRLVIQGDGLPRLTVSPRCKNLIREFESYEWMPDKPKDTPKKVNDHALDALRYAVMEAEMDGGGVLVRTTGERDPWSMEAAIAERNEARRRFMAGEDVE